MSGPIPPGYWRTRHGQMLAIRDMTYMHLYNTIVMLGRKLASLRADVDCFAPQAGESIDDVSPDFSDIFVDAIREIEDKRAELEAERTSRESKRTTCAL